MSTARKSGSDLDTKSDSELLNMVRYLNAASKQKGQWGFGDLARAGEALAILEERKDNVYHSLTAFGWGSDRLSGEDAAWLINQGRAAWYVIKHVRACEHQSE